MIELTQELREMIADYAVEESASNGAFNVLRQELIAWAKDARIESLGGAAAAKALDAWIETAAEMQEKHPSIVKEVRIRRKDYISFNVGETNYSVHYGTGMVSFNRDRSGAGVPVIPLPTPSNDGGDVVFSRKLDQRFFDLMVRYRDLRQELDDLRASILLILEGIPTLAQLSEAWPEALKLLQDKESLDVSAHTVEKIADMNTRLGL